MAPRITNGDATTKRIRNKGAWSAEEDTKLAQYIEIHGAKRWKTVALKSGLNRCGKSCRLRWLNYLRPNIKRGDFSNEEEDLILRLHKLLGNRWSLIAGRLPGRTDNEIKNYWNSHLRRKINQKEKTPKMSAPLKSIPESTCTIIDQVVDESRKQVEDFNFDDIDLFDFSIEGCHELDWVDKFLELVEDPCLTEIK